MNIKTLVATSLLLISGPALAQTYAEPMYVEQDQVYVEQDPVYVLETIQVRPIAGNAMSFDCGDLDSPRPIDVESLLQINDRTQTQQLTNKLMNAVDEACRAGVATIVVERSVSGRSVVWYPEGEFDAAVTSADTDY